MEVSTLLSYRYSDKFGLLEKEVDQILKDYGIEFEMEEVKKWYNGYLFGDTETFEYIFKEFVIKTFSYFDTGGEESEKVYHAFVLGLLVNLSSTYEVKSNKESGYGRYDVMLIPKDISKIGIIIEFKKANKMKSETLEEAAEEALNQVEEKNYKQELIDRGIKKIISLGVAFEGKNVMINEKKSYV